MKAGVIKLLLCDVTEIWASYTPVAALKSLGLA